MRLAYLDTSYLSALARVRRNQPERFAEFLDFWTDQKLALAFSTIHMRETLRYGGRQERFELLQLLLPVASDLPLTPIEGPCPANLTETEVLRALADQGRVRLAHADHRAKVDQWCKVWTTECWTAAESAFFALYDQEPIQQMESVVYAAHSTGAKASSRPSDKPYTRTRLSDMSAQVPTAEQADHAREMMLAALEEPEFWNDFPWQKVGLTPEQGKAETTAIIDRMLEQMKALGPKAAYLQQLGIKNPEQFERTFTDDLIQQWWFDNTVREVVRKLASGNAELCEQVIALNLLPHCPGTWLKSRLVIEISKAVATPEPNHEYDLDHLSYSPYVDVFLCDKEMAQLARQVLRRPDVPAFFRDKPVPISPALDIESIQKAVEP